MLLHGFDLGANDARNIASLEEYLVLYLSGLERKFTDKIKLIETGKVNEITDPVH